MDYTKKFSETSKQCNFIQNKPMNEQIKQLLIEQLQKKKSAEQVNEQKEVIAQEN